MPQYTTISTETDSLKRCTKCGDLKPATPEYFPAEKAGKNGLHAQCRLCTSARDKLRRSAKPSKFQEEKNKFELEHPGMKRCTGCGEIKPATAEFFSVDKRGSVGLVARCRVCQYAFIKRWNNKNRERVRKTVRRSKDKSIARARQIKIQWALAHPGMKRCKCCGEIKPDTLENFGRYQNGNGKVGTRRTCNECRSVQSKAWRKNNPEKLREYRLKSNSHNANYMRQWYHTNRDKARENKRRWYRANLDHMREKSRCYANARRARKLNATGRFTPDDVRRQLTGQKHRCWWCNVKLKGNAYEVDHRIPLSRGGSNAPDNIVIACEFCNRSKHDRMPWEWGDRLL